MEYLFLLLGIIFGLFFGLIIGGQIGADYMRKRIEEIDDYFKNKGGIDK